MDNNENHASYDLHLHTCWSYDATAPVEYYFKRARELKLRTIAITEHFSMDSLPEILSVSKQYPDVRFIPAAEMTVSVSGGGAVDMVCLGLPTEIPNELEKVFEAYRQWQRDFGDAISEGLRKKGFVYEKDDRFSLIKQYRPQNTIDKQGMTLVQNGIQRDHLIGLGAIRNNMEYSELLQGFDLPKLPGPDKVLPVIKNCGGLVAIAHPTGYFNRNDLKRMDALREELGFEGIECAHDLVPDELTPFYREYCLKHGLFSTAGSDNHADPANNPYKIGAHHKFARHKGQPEWLEEILQRLTLRKQA